MSNRGISKATLLKDILNELVIYPSSNKRNSVKFIVSIVVVDEVVLICKWEIGDNFSIYGILK